MSRHQALEIAPADPLGRRWATARRHGRLYLTWRGPEGDGEVQIGRHRYGVRSFQQVTIAPDGLCWRPVLQVWTELPLQPGEPADSVG